MAKKQTKTAWNWFHIIKELLIDSFVFIVAGCILVAAGISIWIASLDIPDLSAFEERRVLQSTKIFDKTGEVLLYDLNQDVRRTIIPFDQISQYIKDASIAIEDDQFYSHIGIDFKAIGRAFIANIQAGGFQQGGSTITQQVIKNSILEQEQTLTRKVKEAILSIKLERSFSKDAILGVYLNESPYGGTIYGVEEAAQSFFGKSASDVTLAEAAYIAALPQAPTYLSPFGSNKDALDERQKLVLERMFVNGFITADEYDTATLEQVTFKKNIAGGIKAPHFVMYVIEQLSELYDENRLAEQGLRVITTLDYSLQEKAEEIVARKTIENAAKFDATNAGMVAVEPQTGDVLVMVGSRDYFSEEIDGNFNVTTALRQPGSVIKPFIYATAWQKGYLPDTVVFDLPTQFSPSCAADDLTSNTTCYAPQNYNNKFVGPISMRNALAQSLNIPAVKTLYLAGISESLKFVADMGLTTLNDPDRYGLTLVLGGGEVRLLDMTHAYSVFANDGVKATPRTILRIETIDGQVQESFPVQTTPVLDTNIARMVNDVLSDNIARTPLWGQFSLVNFGDRDVALKSGSTNDLRDAWILGYTPNIAVGAWVGNNDNRMMNGGLSGLITTPMWREFMDVALAERPIESFTTPQINTFGVKPILQGEYIDTTYVLSQLQSQNASQATLGSLTNTIHTILHFVHKDNPNGPYPTNPTFSDAAYQNWEYGVQKWKQNTFTPVTLPINETTTRVSTTTTDLVDTEVTETDEVQ